MGRQTCFVVNVVFVVGKVVHMKAGLNVSRSVYQKVVEENKKLMRDIMILVDPKCNPEKRDAVVNKHRDRLIEIDRQSNLLREMFRLPLIDQKRWIPLLIFSLILCSCSSTQRQNRQLRLSKEHLNRALQLGAVLDSTKTIIHDTISIDKIHDRIVRITKYDTLKLQAICPEAKTLGQKKAIQKLVCPDVIKDTIYHERIIIQGKTYNNPIHIIASSVAGAASLQIDAKPLTIPYVKETVQINAKPANIRKWWQNWLIYIGIFVAGVIAGFILKMFLKLGVNL